MNKVEVRPDGLFSVEEFGHPYDPPVCLLKFPVTKGAKWTTATKRRDIGPVEYTREAGGTRNQVYWFAPEVGIIKIEGVRTLTKYTPGKQSIRGRCDSHRPSFPAPEGRLRVMVLDDDKRRHHFGIARFIVVKD